jgi:2-polyprenyl-3-methyl-5-hydroxy-6-metoxy-1,4-benzoquinol methylase
VLRGTLIRNGCHYGALKEILEFGCGVGRVTRWLAGDRVTVFAYDISEPHLQIAEKYAQAPRSITWRLLRSIRDLDSLPKVDLAYSLIVLQHNPPPLMALIIRSMLKALKPNGVAVFQIPTYKFGYRFAISEYLNAENIGGMEMHVLPQRSIFEIVRGEGCNLLEILEDGWTGNRDGEVSNTFVILKSS